jgi:hypothetical protein
LTIQEGSNGISAENKSSIVSDVGFRPVRQGLGPIAVSGFLKSFHYGIDVFHDSVNFGLYAGVEIIVHFPSPITAKT